MTDELDFIRDDTYVEELELDLLEQELEHRVPGASEHALDRKIYFSELFRLQRELVKLQDWVVDRKLKVVVLFEGRDAAGKGGVIKRISQRLNPRVCRTVALIAPNEREKSQWYSSATSLTCPPAARSCCSIAAGTTAPASSA